MIDSITWLAASQACLIALLIADRRMRKPQEEPVPTPFVRQCLRLERGAVVLLETEKVLSHHQYAALREYLAAIEQRTGTRFEVIDGGLRAVAVRSSE